MMNMKILLISSMYPGYLESFYEKHNITGDISYEEHYKLLLEKSTEFVGSYTRGFRKIGADAQFVLANDRKLQAKWASEKGLKHKSDSELLYDQVRIFQPEILWIDNLSFVSREWLENIRNEQKCIRLIIGYHCSPYGPKILDTLRAVDFVFTCTPGFKTDLEKKGIKSYLVYHAFDDAQLSMIPESSEKVGSDFVFSGSLISGAGFHDERIKMIEKILKENIDISLYVNLEKRYKIFAKQAIYYLRNTLVNIGLEKLTERIPLFGYGKTKIAGYSSRLLKSCRRPVYGTDMIKLFRNSAIVLNMHIGVAGDYAGNMRMFEVTGTGSCLLTDKKTNLSDLFDAGSEVVAYDSTEDCIGKIKWLMNHEYERKRIAAAGHKRTILSHTVEKRCVQMIGIITEELKKAKRT
jgi:spore maturation protein CgeB